MKPLLLILALGLAVLRAEAETFVVTTNADAGPGSLRQAILDANAAPGDDVITFAPSLNGQTIRLTTGQLIANGNVSILGPGQDQCTIDGGGTNRVFYFSGGSTNLISGVTITNGSVRNAVAQRGGGGIFNDRAMLTVSNVTLIRNSAQAGGGHLQQRRIWQHDPEAAEHDHHGQLGRQRRRHLQLRLFWQRHPHAPE
jgi:hypothetical protein